MPTEMIRVFLAEAHEMVRTALSVLLENEAGFELVGLCGDGWSAIEQVRTLAPDVVVLGIAMPSLNGLDVCRELTRRGKKASILILTMHDDEQFIVRAFRYGAAGYLRKESAGEELIAAIRAVTRGELFLGAGLPRHVLDGIAKAGPEPYDRLTTRERQVLKLIAEGMTSRRIAEHLGLAVKTIHTHRTRLTRKLDIHDQTTLVKFALSKGLVTA